AGVVTLHAGVDLRQEHVAGLLATRGGVAAGAVQHAVALVAEQGVLVPALGDARRPVLGQSVRALFRIGFLLMAEAATTPRAAEEGPSPLRLGGGARGVLSRRKPPPPPRPGDGPGWLRRLRHPQKSRPVARRGDEPRQPVAQGPADHFGRLPRRGVWSRFL